MLQIICIFFPLAFMTVFMGSFIKRCSPPKAQWVIWSLFLIYIWGNLYFTLFSRTLGSGQHLEIIPFRRYGHLFKCPPEGEILATGFAALFLHGTLPIVGLILNILLYYPLGYLLSITFPKLKNWHVIIIGCLCSIATEATQYVFEMGFCETDDVIHNTLGTAIGVWVWHLQSKRLNKSTQ